MSTLIAQSWQDVVGQGPFVVAMGNFDGVHLGHQKILDTLVQTASQANLRPLVLTFEPHPSFLFQPNKAPDLLSTPQEKDQLLAKWPVDRLFLKFDASLANLAATDFVEELLLKRLDVKKILLGPDHCFGKGAKGNSKLLAQYLGQENVLPLPSFLANGIPVSSSRIRELLEQAKLEEAANLLGAPFFYSGVVGHGDHRGRTLGFPTANLDIGYRHKTMVPFGVYGIEAEFSDKPNLSHYGVMNLGRTPTFGSQKTKIEAHLFDYQDNAYGKALKVKLLFSLRTEKQFQSADELVGQIRTDIDLCKSRLKILVPAWESSRSNQ